MMLFPKVTDTKNVHTRMNKKVFAEISRIAQESGANKNAVINTLLVKSLEEGFMAGKSCKGGKKTTSKKKSTTKKK